MLVLLSQLEDDNATAPRVMLVYIMLVPRAIAGTLQRLLLLLANNRSVHLTFLIFCCQVTFYATFALDRTLPCRCAYASSLTVHLLSCRIRYINFHSFVRFTLLYSVRLSVNHKDASRLKCWSIQAPSDASLPASKSVLIWVATYSAATLLAELLRIKSTINFQIHFA